MKFTEFPVSGTSPTIGMPWGILMVPRPGRKRVQFHPEFMKFSYFPPFSWKTQNCAQNAIFAVLAHFGPPSAKAYKSCMVQCILGVKSPQGAILVKFRNSHQNGRKCAKISWNELKWAKINSIYVKSPEQRVDLCANSWTTARARDANARALPGRANG